MGSTFWTSRVLPPPADVRRMDKAAKERISAGANVNPCLLCSNE